MIENWFVALDEFFTRNAEGVIEIFLPGGRYNSRRTEYYYQHGDQKIVLPLRGKHVGSAHSGQQHWNFFSFLKAQLGIPVSVAAARIEQHFGLPPFRAPPPSSNATRHASQPSPHAPRDVNGSNLVESYLTERGVDLSFARSYGLELDESLTQERVKERLDRITLPPGVTAGIWAPGLCGQSKVYALRCLPTPAKGLPRFLCPKERAPIFLSPRLRSIAHDISSAITFTEGITRLCVLEQNGYPVIAGNGVWSFHCQDQEGKRILRPELRQLSQTQDHPIGFHWDGRKVYLAFDADLEKNPVVRRANLSLFLMLTQAGAAVYQLRWDPAIAKGIDDLVVAARAQGKNDRDCLKELFAGAKPYLQTLSSGDLKIVEDELARVFLGPGRLSQLAQGLARVLSITKAAVREMAQRPLKLGPGEQTTQVAEALDLEAQKAKAMLEHAAKVLAKLDAYFEPHSRKFAIKVAETWELRTEETFTRYLRSLGVDTARIPGKKISPAEWIIEELAHSKVVDYIGELAGYQPGFYQFNTLRVLVNRGPALFSPQSGGSCTTIRSFIEGLLGENSTEGLDPGAIEATKDRDQIGQTQINTFYGWLRRRLAALEANTGCQSQINAFIGPVDCGKSVLLSLIARLTGQRVAHPILFFTGATTFNDDLARAENLIVDDENLPTSIAERRNLGTAYVRVAVCQDAEVHPKGHPKHCLPLRQFLNQCLNDQSDRFLSLPPFEAGIADKINLFHCCSFSFPMPLETAEEQSAFWAKVTLEAPAFIHWLLEEFQLPPALADRRFGVKTFHHPILLAKIHAHTPSIQLLALIDEAKPWDKNLSAILAGEVPSDSWSGSSRRLQQILFDNGLTSHDAKKLLHYPNATGRYLNDLADSHPKRIKFKHTSSVNLWTIKQPPLI